MILTDRKPAARGVQRHQVATFFALSFGISWAVWIGLAAAPLGIGTRAGAVLNVVAIAGPSIAAVALSIALGRRQLRQPLAGFSPLNVLLTWIIAILVVVRFGRARLASSPLRRAATAP